MGIILPRPSTQPLNEPPLCNNSNTTDLGLRPVSHLHHDLCPPNPDLLNLISILDPTVILLNMPHKLLKLKLLMATKTCLSMLLSQDLSLDRCRLSKELLMRGSLSNQAIHSNKPLHPHSPTLGLTLTVKLCHSARCLLRLIDRPTVPRLMCSSLHDTVRRTRLWAIK